MRLPVLGDVPVETIGWAGAAAGVAVLLRELIPHFLQLRKDKRQAADDDRRNRKEDDNEIIAHQSKLLDRAESQLRDKDKEVRELIEVSSKKSVSLGKFTLYVKYLESLLHSHKVVFERWQIEDVKEPPSVTIDGGPTL